MRIISRRTLQEFWEIHPDAEQPLKAWLAEAKKAQWQNPNDIKRTYRNASIASDNRVVFNIKGNDYRLIVHVRYDIGILFIRFIGTHRQYDKIDANRI